MPRKQPLSDQQWRQVAWIVRVLHWTTSKLFVFVGAYLPKSECAGLREAARALLNAKSELSQAMHKRRGPTDDLFYVKTDMVDVASLPHMALRLFREREAGSGGEAMSVPAPRNSEAKRVSDS